MDCSMSCKTEWEKARSNRFCSPSAEKLPATPFEPPAGSIHMHHGGTTPLAFPRHVQDPLSLANRHSQEYLNFLNSFHSTLQIESHKPNLQHQSNFWKISGPPSLAARPAQGGDFD